MAQRHLKAVERAARRVDQARAALGDAILAAQRSGESLTDIAPHAGLSRSRVHELAREAAKRQTGG